MKYYLLTFRSVTFAQRGERLLKSKGYRCGIQRTPKWMEERGCGYSVKVQTGNVDMVLDILEENQLVYRKVYVQRGDGSLEEVPV